jgi:TPR repeat protein
MPRPPAARVSRLARLVRLVRLARLAPALAFAVTGCAARSAVVAAPAPPPDCTRGEPGACVAACDGGVLASCDKAGDRAHAGPKTPEQRALAIRFYTRACDGGFFASCNKLGEIRLDQTVDAKDQKAEGDRAVPLFQRSCDGGDMAGCAALGELYLSGTSVEANRERGLALHERACSGGRLPACVELGKQYLSSEDNRPADPTRAAAVFERACDGGDTAGCAGLLTAIVAGGPSEQAATRLASEATRACDEGQLDGCTVLAGLYERGEAGLRKDASRAFALYAGSCTRGNSACDSCYRLRPQDAACTYGHLQAACSGKDSTACMSLGEVELSKHHPIAGTRAYGSACDLGVAQGCYQAGLVGYEQTEEYLKRACDGGVADGCTRLADGYYAGWSSGEQKDFAAAATFAKRGCDLNDLHACARLGAVLAAGEGVGKDTTRATELLRRACDGSKGAWGCADLGRLHHEGAGAPRDDAQAAARFKQACDAGDLPGCGELAALTLRGEGVTKDAAAAAALFARGCHPDEAHKDAADACVSLGLRLMWGTKVARDRLTALELFRAACDAASEAGCVEMGILYVSGGDGVPRDLARGSQLLDHGCTASNNDACAEELFRGINTKPDRKQATDYWRTTCANGAADSCARLREAGLR